MEIFIYKNVYLFIYKYIYLAAFSYIHINTHIIKDINR